MKTFAKIFLCAIALLLLAWKLPELYNTFIAKTDRAPFALYSTVADDFIFMGWDEETGIIRRDRKGNNFTQEQTDSLLPLFYARQLLADGRFPDSIHGRHLDPHEIQRTSFNFRSRAIENNKRPIGLYFLLESMPRRLDLDMPSDAFYIDNNGIHFIDMATNIVDADKSMIFTRALATKGFRFPATVISGNGTSEKEYDDGYLIVDNDGKLFNLKMTKGRPYVKAFTLPDGVKPAYSWVTEFPDRKLIGLMVSDDRRLWVIERDGDGNNLKETGVSAYDYKSQDMTIFGNIFDWTVMVTSNEREDYYALNADDYSLITSHTEPNVDQRIPGLTFTSYSDPDVKPRLSR